MKENCHRCHQHNHRQHMSTSRSKPIGRDTFMVCSIRDMSFLFFIFILSSMQWECSSCFMINTLVVKIKDNSQINNEIFRTRRIRQQSPSIIPQQNSRYSQSSSLLHSSSSSNGGSNDKNKNNKKNLTNAERERREEEMRRKERKNDVVINKTSAKKDAKDYPIDPQATTEQYLKQASRIEQQIFHLTEQGMEALKYLQLQEADECFNKVFDLKPDAYLWQAGIVKFYLGDIIQAGNVFARCAELFESKFGGSPASEERIWRDACELKLLNSMSSVKRKKLDEAGGIHTLIPQIRDPDHNDEEDEDDFTAFTRSENRKVIKLTRDLFEASIEENRPAEVLARARLMSIGGTSSGSGPVKVDYKMRKLNSLYYLGLHHDVMGEEEESKNCLKMALKLSPSSGKSSDIVQTLPLLHMTIRDWFDDDLFDDDLLTDDDEGNISKGGSSSGGMKEKLSNQHLSDAYSDPLLEASIMEGVRKMKHRELKAALKIRGLPATGSKEILQERLFYSLMEDAGYQSGFSP